MQLAKACAASKTSFAPVWAASASSPATSQAERNAWVPAIAAVRGVTAACAVAAVRHHVAGSTSAKRGARPFHSTAWSVEANVNEGSTTRAEGSSSARSASARPRSQFATASGSRRPPYSAQAASKALASGPKFDRWARVPRGGEPVGVLGQRGQRGARDAQRRCGCAVSGVHRPAV